MAFWLATRVASFCGSADRLCFQAPTALSMAAISAVRSVISCVSLAIDALSSSISAWSVSTAAVFSLRVCSFVLSSVSHQPLCSASSLA